MLFISIIILLFFTALPSFFNREQLPANCYSRISSIVLLFCAILTITPLNNIENIGSGIALYGGLFHLTYISQFIDILLFIIGSFILVSWPVKLNSDLNKNPSSDYSLIVLFSLLGASLLISSYDLISMYLSIELQSFAVYVLATLYRNSESSTSAGLKYFLLGGLSSCFILFGAGLIYAFTGLTNLESIYSLISVSEFNNLNLTSLELNNDVLGGNLLVSSDVTKGVFLGVIFIIVGFLFKIAAAPLHNWSPDVYDDTPTIVTIWLTIMPKISILIFLLEIYTGFKYLNTIGDTQLLNETLNINSVIKNLLLLSSLLSLIIGSVVGLVQTRIKRLLAYSTISHIGFILLALAINSEQSIDSFLFYIIQYTITNLNIFLIIIGLGYMRKKGYFSRIIDIKEINEFKGLFFTLPLICICFSICLFSMAGKNIICSEPLLF